MASIKKTNVKQEINIEKIELYLKKQLIKNDKNETNSKKSSGGNI
jgi:hypothetical protein